MNFRNYKIRDWQSTAHTLASLDIVHKARRRYKSWQIFLNTQATGLQLNQHYPRVWKAQRADP